MFQTNHRYGPFPSVELAKFEEALNVKLPKERIVCPTCNGEGKHVNPNIDAGGISVQELHSDPEFYESYTSGLYDVPCNECKGRNVVDIVNDLLAAEICPKEYKEWREYVRSEEEYRSMEASERRMGC